MDAVIRSEEVKVATNTTWEYVWHCTTSILKVEVAVRGFSKESSMGVLKGFDKGRGHTLTSLRYQAPGSCRGVQNLIRLSLGVDRIGLQWVRIPFYIRAGNILVCMQKTIALPCTRGMWKGEQIWCTFGMWGNITESTGWGRSPGGGFLFV
jgi:hypothetical protein